MAMCSFFNTKFQDVAQHVKHPSIHFFAIEKFIDPLFLHETIDAITLSIELENKVKNIEGYSFLVILFAQKEKGTRKIKIHKFRIS